MTDKTTLINIESTNTFEQWRTLTNSQTNVIKQAVTMGANSGDNIGDVTLKGSLTIAPGVFTDPVHNSLGHLNVNKIYAQTDVDPYIELGNNVEVVGDWIKLTSVNADEAVEIQFQNNGTDSWGIATNANHTQLTIGDGSHAITFNSVNNSITSSDLTIHNAMLGPTIDGIIIGSNTATSATFTDVEGTTIEATTGFTGNLIGNVTGNLAGDIFASNGTEKILENGTNGTDATFRGSILNDNGTEILAHGSNNSAAFFVGNVQGNLDGVADEATLAQDANKSKVIEIHSPHEAPEGGQNGEHYITFVDGVEDIAYTTARPASHGDNNRSYQNLEDHSDLRYNPAERTLKVPNVESTFSGDLTGSVTGNLSGNANKASYLDNTPSIGGVTFDGYKSIDLKGVNKAGDQNTSGKAATAGHADKAGHANTAGSATTAAACTGNAAKASSTSGNASTASRLATARTIGGVSFNGTASISLPGVNVSGNQNTSGKAATAGHADKAGYATTAGTAGHANTAGHATTATKATNAGHATTAAKATNATNAVNSTNATGAGYANTAGHANTAGYATTAGTANLANKAGHATTATKAASAGHATTAAKATNATNAVNSTNAGHATKATSAGSAKSATKATSATTATTAGKATQANYWTTARTLTLKGDVSGAVSVRGNSAMSLGVTVNSGTHHSHTLSQISDFDAEVGKLVDVDQIWPLGAVICMSNDTNPQSTLAGSWTEFGRGQVLVGATGTRHYSNSDPFRKYSGTRNAGRTGGKVSYTLKNSEMPSHRHVSNVVGEGARGLNAGATGGNPQVPHQRGFDIGKSSTNSSWTSYQGGGNAFQITMPYVTVRWWVRYA